MNTKKWTFVTTYFRNHGVSYFEMILKALCEEPVDFEALSNDQERKFDQVALVKKNRPDFPKSLDQAIYLVPKGFRKDKIRYTAAYSPWYKRESGRLNKSITEQYGKKAEDVIRQFDDLLNKAEKQKNDNSDEKFVPDYIELASDIFEQTNQMHDLWQIIHELPLGQQIEWFEKYSHFKDNLAVGTWAEIQDKKSEIKIVEIGKPGIMVEDISSWAEAISDWLDELPMDKELGINLLGTSTENQLAWRYLKQRKIKLKHTVFFNIKTNTFDDEPRRFRKFQFKKAPQTLIEKKIDLTPENDWYSKTRQKAWKKLENFNEWSDLFSIVVFGNRGTGKSRMIKKVFSNGNEEIEHIHEINCAAIPETLAESELFGHKKGAFTGAINDEEGAFGKLQKYYNNKKKYGVLFLDEFHHLPKNIQSKLLTSLQMDEKGFFSYKPLGSTKQEKVKFQLILGTNHTEENLRAETSQILPDFLDRVLQRKVHMPPLAQKEILNAWQAVWQQMGFPTSVDDPLTGDSKESFGNWLSQLNFPGNFRDIQRLCILTADIIRESHGEAVNTETFKVLKKEVDRDGGWKRDAVEPHCNLKDGDEPLILKFDHDWYSDPQKTIKKTKKTIAEKLIESHGGKTPAVDAVKQSIGKDISLSTLSRWLNEN